MPPPNSQPSKFLFPAILLLVVASLSVSVEAKCDSFFGNDFSSIYVKESGEFSPDWVLTTTLNKVDSGWSSITIGDNDLTRFFEVTDTRDDFILTVSSLSEWYDAEDTVVPEDTQDLLLTYTCESTGQTSAPKANNLFIYGENTQTPTFEGGNEYSGIISKSMTPVDVSLDCLPGDDFHMVVVDGDYIATKTGIPNVDQGSSNVVTCSTKIGASPEDYFDCSAEELAPGVAGRYKINLKLKKSLTTITGNEYEFIVVAQDQADPPLSSEATVRLNFADEDTSPPLFSQSIYQHDGISTQDQMTVGTIFPLGIDVTDATWAGPNQDISILLEGTQMECNSCFDFTQDKTGLVLAKDLSQDVLTNAKGSLIVVLEASESSGTGRKSRATVKIPVLGRSPKFASETYSMKIDQEGAITGENYPFVSETAFPSSSGSKYRLISGDGVESCLSIADSGTELQLSPNVNEGIECLQNLHSNRYQQPISFLVEVADNDDPTKLGRSLVTISYPPKKLATMTSTTTTITTSPSEETTTPTGCPTCPSPLPCTTTTPEIGSTTTTECSCPSTTPTACPVCPSTTTVSATSCPSPTPCTTTTPDPSTGPVEIISGDFGDSNIQHIGYPDFVTVENAVQMPLGRVEATSDDPDVQIRFSLSGSQNFYINDQTGDIFLISNDGDASLNSASESFTVYVNEADEYEKSIAVKVEGLAKEKVMVYEAAAEFSIDKLNGINSTVWFRLLNSQPMRDTSMFARASSSSLLFLTAFTGDGEDGRFLTRDEAASIASNLEGISINNDIEVDHHMTADEGDEGGASAATIVLAVILALVLLAAIAVLLFVKRRVIMGRLQRRRKPQNNLDRPQNQRKADSEVSSAIGSVKTKPRSQGMFNLQSTTIQINSHENGKAPTQVQPPHQSVPHHQARSGLMREVSTELEKKLESRQKDRPITVTSTSQVSARKGRAPATPSRPVPPSAPAGITFNPVAEVVEVEKRQQRASISSQGSTGSGSSVASSGSSVTDNEEETTRI